MTEILIVIDRDVASDVVRFSLRTSTVENWGILSKSLSNRFLLLLLLFHELRLAVRSFLELVAGGLRCDICPRVIDGYHIRSSVSGSIPTVVCDKSRRGLSTSLASSVPPRHAVTAALALRSRGRKCGPGAVRDIRMAARMWAAAARSNVHRCVPSCGRRARAGAVPRHRCNFWRDRRRTPSSRHLGACSTRETSPQRKRNRQVRVSAPWVCAPGSARSTRQPRQRDHCKERAKQVWTASCVQEAGTERKNLPHQGSVHDRRGACKADFHATSRHGDLDGAASSLHATRTSTGWCVASRAPECNPREKFAWYSSVSQISLRASRTPIGIDGVRS